jgi:hypothetical protein
MIVKTSSCTIMCIQPSRAFLFGNNWCIAWLRLHSAAGFLSERGETDVVRYLRYRGANSFCRPWGSASQYFLVLSSTSLSCILQAPFSSRCRLPTLLRPYRHARLKTAHETENGSQKETVSHHGVRCDFFA